jgi:hypothetical protein
MESSLGLCGISNGIIQLWRVVLKSGTKNMGLALRNKIRKSSFTFADPDPGSGAFLFRDPE